MSEWLRRLMVRQRIALALYVPVLLLLIGSLFMLFLATRSAVFVWSGALIWSMLFLMGPVVMLLGDGYPPFQAGFWSWAGWIFLIALAHFLMAPHPRRVIPSGSPPSPERAPSA